MTENQDTTPATAPQGKPNHTPEAYADWMIRRFEAAVKDHYFHDDEEPGAAGRYEHAKHHMRLLIIAARTTAPAVAAYLEWRRLGWAPIGADPHPAANEFDAARLEFHRLMLDACTTLAKAEGRA